MKRWIGKRNRVEYVGINNFNDRNLQNDYHFLEDVLQEKARGKRTLQICGGYTANGKRRWQPDGNSKKKKEFVVPSTFPQPPKPSPTATVAMELASSSSFSLSKGVTKLINACRERDISLVTMPLGMSRRKMNTTRYIEKADTILWRWVNHIYFVCMIFVSTKLRMNINTNHFHPFHISRNVKLQ